MSGRQRHIQAALHIIFTLMLLKCYHQVITIVGIIGILVIPCAVYFPPPLPEYCIRDVRSARNVTMKGIVLCILPHPDYRRLV